MVAPRFTDKRWAVALSAAIGSALLLTIYGWSNVAIPLAAASGALCFYMVKFKTERRSP